MLHYKNKLAFVVATKDRPAELGKMLKSLGVQSYRPDQVVIVDGSDQSVEGTVQEFPNLRISYLRCTPPSAARQRNVGIEAVDPGVNLVGFFDDDIELASDALQKMCR